MIDKKDKYPDDCEYPKYYRCIPTSIPIGGYIWGMSPETDRKNIELLNKKSEEESIKI